MYRANACRPQSYLGRHSARMKMARGTDFCHIISLFLKNAAIVSRINQRHSRGQRTETRSKVSPMMCLRSRQTGPQSAPQEQTTQAKSPESHGHSPQSERIRCGGIPGLRCRILRRRFSQPHVQPWSDTRIPDSERSDRQISIQHNLGEPGLCWCVAGQLAQACGGRFEQVVHGQTYDSLLAASFGGASEPRSNLISFVVNIRRGLARSFGWKLGIVSG